MEYLCSANVHNRLMTGRIKSKLRGESYTKDSVMVNTLQNTYAIKCKLDDLADFVCPTCAFANSKRRAISSTHNPDVKATKVGERIYVDIKSLKAVSRGSFSRGQMAMTIIHALIVRSPSQRLNLWVSMCILLHHTHLITTKLNVVSNRLILRR